MNLHEVLKEKRDKMLRYAQANDAKPDIELWPHNFHYSVSDKKVETDAERKECADLSRHSSWKCFAEADALYRLALLYLGDNDVKSGEFPKDLQSAHRAEKALTRIHDAIGNRASHGPMGDAACALEWISDAKCALAELKEEVRLKDVRIAELEKALTLNVTMKS